VLAVAPVASADAASVPTLAALPVVAGRTPDEVAGAVDALGKIDAALAGWAGANDEPLSANVARLVAEHAVLAERVAEIDALEAAPVVRHAEAKKDKKNAKRKYTRRAPDTDDTAAS
jgi:hypothetical protein